MVHCVYKNMPNLMSVATVRGNTKIIDDAKQRADNRARTRTKKRVEQKCSKCKYVSWNKNKFESINGKLICQYCVKKKPYATRRQIKSN